MMLQLLAAVAVILPLSTLPTTTCASTAPAEGLLVTGDTLSYYASFIHNAARTGPFGIMQFGPFRGHVREKILEIPLGFIKPQSSIRLTVGIDPTAANARVDQDPFFGITDGTSEYLFAVPDPTNYDDPPCYPHPAQVIGATNTGTLVPANTKYPAQVTMVFRPFFQYGTCYTAQNGGYVNIAKFADKLDTSKPLSLLVRRDDDSQEQYKFYYFQVEILD